MDEAVKLIDSITKLLGVLVWPGLLAYVLVRFGPSLRDFMSSMGEFSLKGAGFEASAKRQKAEAAAALAAAAVARPDDAATPEGRAEEARAAVEIVSEAVTPRMLRRAGNSTVLWVDDKPENNIYERRALEALGVNFVLSTSTEDALQKLKSQAFDAIISDMGRPPDAQAGYTLLDKLRSVGDHTPYIIYAGSRAQQHRAEARRRGALDCTNRANDLFEIVLSALGRRA